MGPLADQPDHYFPKRNASTDMLMERERGSNNDQKYQQALEQPTRDDIMQIKDTYRGMDPQVGGEQTQ